MTADGPYALAWRRFRRRRWVFLMSMLVLTVLGPNGHWYHLPERSVGWLIIAGVSSFVVGTLSLQLWTCPRCHQPLCGRWLGDFRCKYCGLYKYDAGP